MKTHSNHKTIPLTCVLAALALFTGCSAEKKVDAVLQPLKSVGSGGADPVPAGQCDFSAHSEKFGVSKGEAVTEAASVPYEILIVGGISYSRKRLNLSDRSSTLIEVSGEDSEQLKSGCYGSTSGKIALIENAIDEIPLMFLKSAEKIAVPVELSLKLNAGGADPKLEIDAASVDDASFLNPTDAVLKSSDWNELKIFKISAGEYDFHLRKNVKTATYEESIQIIVRYIENKE